MAKKYFEKYIIATCTTWSYTQKPGDFNIAYKCGQGFPGSSAVKEPFYNAGDPGSIPGSGSSTKEGIGYPLQYSWASLVAQMEKNPPVMRETWVQSLGWKYSLEKKRASSYHIFAQNLSITLRIKSQDLSRDLQNLYDLLPSPTAPTVFISTPSHSPPCFLQE